MHTVLFYNYETLHEFASLYIHEIIEMYKSRKSLRPSSQCILDIPKIRTNKYRARQFCNAVETSWNAIYNRLKNSEHVDDLRKRLKTHHFEKYYYFSTQPG